MHTKKSKVLLVNPGWFVHDGNIGALPDLYPPMGLGCIASVLRQDGFDVQMLDLAIEQIESARVADYVYAFRPDIVGITAVTMTYPDAVEIASVVKLCDPTIVTIVGGPHITTTSREVLYNENFDYSIAGSGEKPILQLCNGIYENNVPQNIPGVNYHKAPTPFSVPIMPFSIQGYPPIAYDLFNLKKYKDKYGKIAIITSIGCNAKCIYCSSGYLMPKSIPRSIDNIITELEYLVNEIGFKYINIYDSNLTFRRNWVMQICDLIIERGLKFQWRCFSENVGFDEELVAKMKQAGCSHILFGVETSHDKTLKLIRKGHRSDQPPQAFRLTREGGIKRVAYSIIGLPGEGREDVLSTIDYLEKLDAEYYILSPITVLPGTPLYDNMDMYQMDILSDVDNSKLGSGMATASNGILSAEEIQELTDYAFARLNKGRTTYDWSAESEELSMAI